MNVNFRTVPAWPVILSGLFLTAHTALSAALPTPPPGAKVWLAVTTARTHGQVSTWTAPDGGLWSRQTIALRGQTTDVSEHVHLDADGNWDSLDISGYTPEGDASETYIARDGNFRYKTPAGSGSGRTARDLVYYPFSQTLPNLMWLAERLHRHPGEPLRLVPYARASLAPLTALTVRSGSHVKHLTAYVIDGIDFAPQPVWFDGDDFFASLGELSFIQDGWQGTLTAITAAQSSAIAQRQPQILARVAPRQLTPVAFVDVQTFDAEARVFREHQTVVVEDGRITAVGPAASIQTPANASIYPGAGKTLLPGLWDSHQHYQGDESGPLLLSQGITSIRDPGNDNAQTVDRARRYAAGQLLAPTIYASSLLDGVSPTTAQSAVVVSSKTEALRAVRSAKQQGFVGIKIYGSYPPSLVSITADEAHRLGLHVHGHLPAGMRPLDAVHAGYDELTHINLVMMQFMPDAIVRVSNTDERIYGPGRYTADLDLRSPPVVDFIEELARRKITVDPTLETFEKVYVAEKGVLTPAAAHFEGTLPLNVDYYYRLGASVPRAEATRERMAASFAKMQAMVFELHRRGVRIVAGTDDYGLELVRELELYQAAGMSAADALACATIEPARLLNVSDRTGSIVVGKLADLVLIDGDPVKRLGDLRQVAIVTHDGRLMTGQALRAAAGLTGPAR